MKRNYFTTEKNADELKQSYKRLCKIYHPDIAGYETTSIMQEINIEYKELLKICMKNDGLTDTEITFEIEEEEIYMEKIRSICNLEGLIIELIGKWIWVSGNTYSNKNDIKQAGFIYASLKKMWFWRPNDAKCKKSKNKDISEIREKYGVKEITYKTKLI